MFQLDYVIYSSENVVLTHIIKCKIKINKPQNTQQAKKCDICQESADVYCENDNQYFCEACDILTHDLEDSQRKVDSRQKRIKMMQANHKRVKLTDLEKKPFEFGTCENPKCQHRVLLKDEKSIEKSTRENEYYDEVNNKAYCTTCAIEITQNQQENLANSENPKIKLKKIDDCYR